MDLGESLAPLRMRAFRVPILADDDGRPSPTRKKALPIRDGRETLLISECTRQL